jgi:hypothetical protein
VRSRRATAPVVCRTHGNKRDPTNAKYGSGYFQ